MSRVYIYINPGLPRLFFELSLTKNYLCGTLGIYSNGIYKWSSMTPTLTVVGQWESSLVQMLSSAPDDAWENFGKSHESRFIFLGQNEKNKAENKLLRVSANIICCPGPFTQKKWEPEWTSSLCGRFNKDMSSWYQILTFASGDFPSFQ